MKYVRLLPLQDLFKKISSGSEAECVSGLPGPDAPQRSLLAACYLFQVSMTSGFNLSKCHCAVWGWGVWVLFTLGA